MKRGIKRNRYIMGYSSVQDGDMVVYANDLTEAEEMFEAGMYVIEPREIED